MQQPVSRRDVYSPSLSATIGGRDVELASASMDRMLPDPVAGGSLTAASGDLVALEGPDVVESVATPWDPGTQWPPVPQSPASVSMDTGAGPVSLLANGVVVSASGGTSGREVEVEVADAYESLNRTISWGEFAAAVPSLDEAGLSRYVGLNALGLTDRILRNCGWFSTPPPIEAQVVSVPAQGTMWPEKGIVLSSTRRSAPAGTAGYPTWLNTPWGIGISDISASYKPSTAFRLDERSKRVEMTAMAGRTGGDMGLDLTTEAYGHIRVTWSDTWIYLWATASATGELETIAQVPRVEGFVYATLEYVSEKTVYGTIRAGGASASGTLWAASTVFSSPLKQVDIFGGDTVGAGFQVAYPWAKNALIGWQPNAVLYPRGGNRNTLVVVPNVEGENCADLLAAQCEAEGATYWIDETGVLRWWDLGRLESRASVAELNSDDDIAEAGFTWSHGLSQVKSRVSVKWAEPLREWSWRTSIDLWQSNGETVSPADEPKERWVKPPDDEIWLMVDTNMRMVTDSITDFNYGRFSFYGGVSANTDSWTYSLRASLERVTGAAYKLTTWSTTGLSAEAVQSTPREEDTTTALWRSRRDFDLPIIRGKAKFTLLERITYSAQSGPASAPEHEIDAGWWIQSEAQARYTADYYGARLTVPQPVLSSVDLIPVPGLQLGDVVEVHDTHVTRLNIRGIVVEDSRSLDADMSMSHSVSVRPTYVTRNGVTWEMWGSVASQADDGRWTDWGSRQSGNTYEDWGANPLLGEDVL